MNDASRVEVSQPAGQPTEDPDRRGRPERTLHREHLTERRALDPSQRHPPGGVALEGGEAAVHDGTDMRVPGAGQCADHALVVVTIFGGAHPAEHLHDQLRARLGIAHAPALAVTAPLQFTPRPVAQGPARGRERRVRHPPLGVRRAGRDECVGHAVLEAEDGSVVVLAERHPVAWLQREEGNRQPVDANDAALAGRDHVLAAGEAHDGMPRRETGVFQDEVRVGRPSDVEGQLAHEHAVTRAVLTNERNRHGRFPFLDRRPGDAREPSSDTRSGTHRRR